jgi:hypothetical protein
MAPASLRNNYKVARGTRECRPSTPGAWMGRCERQRIPGRYCRPAATPTTECRKPGRHRPSTGFRLRSFPRSRSNLQHHPDDTPVDLCALALGRAPLAEWSSRRYTRSPGKAGGGRSDLCHHNDEPDSVNRRGRIGENSVDPTAELSTGGRGLLEFVAAWSPSGNEQLPSDLEEWKPELGDDGQGAKCPGCRHVEGLAGRPPPVVLEARMDNRDVGKTQPGHGSRDPVHSAALCVDQGEGRCTIGNSQRQARQTCARSKVGPVLLWLRSSNCRQAESIIQVPLPEPLLFSRPQEPEPDRIGVDLLQGRCISRT